MRYLLALWLLVFTFPKTFGQWSIDYGMGVISSHVYSETTEESLSHNFQPMTNIFASIDLNREISRMFDIELSLAYEIVGRKEHRLNYGLAAPRDLVLHQIMGNLIGHMKIISWMKVGLGVGGNYILMPDQNFNPGYKPFGVGPSSELVFQHKNLSVKVRGFYSFRPFFDVPSSVYTLRYTIGSVRAGLFYTFP